MRFLHMADMHFDSPFISLANKGNLSTDRRLEQRKVFKDIIEYVNQNNIEYLFIAGDLYEQEYVKRSTIDYINKLFKTIPNTKIFITPGNHDPYINNSFYKQYDWSSNVHIFSSELEIMEDENIDIYGYGFDDFYMKSKYPEIEIKNKEKINILITHGSLDASQESERDYNPINSNNLKSMEFDYVALGHIHKKTYNDYQNQKIAYPGSPISLGFDELGERGVLIGNIQKAELNLEFLPIKSRSFEEKEIDITGVMSPEELIETINNGDFNDNNFYKIVLTGKRNFELNIYNILELLQIENIIKIKDYTKASYDIKEIAKQESLKGLFAKRILNKIEQETDENEKDKLIKAFDIGMNVL